MPSPLVSVSVDLDSVACYARIHGLTDGIAEDARHLVLRRCLPRFAELFRRHHLRATFFVVGEDLTLDVEGRALLAELARDGHELANHSFSHPYDLVRLPAERIASEVAQAHDAISAIASTPVLGFRAPGYEISAQVLAELARLGYRYDSSVFPATPYYLAKATVMGAMRILGRRSGSILGSPRVLFAPTEPYRPDEQQPYSRGASPVLELPITVLPWTRLPVIGTALVLAPDRVRRRLVAGALTGPFFNFELHGIDLADGDGDGFPGALIARQPDLGRPLHKKLAALEATLLEAQAVDARFARLCDAAAAFTR